MRYTEQEMIQGCIKNERFFQEMLYRKYFAGMMTLCMRHACDQDTATQILNNGFLKVFKKLDTFSQKGSLESWIRSIIYNCISDYYRNQSKQIRFLDLADKENSLDESVLHQLYFEDIIQLVDDLPPATQSVFMLYAIEGYNHREIGEKLNISEGTSKWHLSAARKQLKELIEKNYKTAYNAS